MRQELKFLSDMEYPGRVIILGSDPSGENSVIVYAITGRSSSSQARKIVFKKNNLLVVPTDDAAVKKGNPDLLIYPAISIEQGAAISNGKQTNDILANLRIQHHPLEILRSALSRWDYESDAPAYTPRISGCVMPSGAAALSIVRRAADANSSRDYFDCPLRPGRGYIVTTYSGKNIDPLPSFSGGPQNCVLKWDSAAETAQAVYDALGTEDKIRDFRVSVACIFAKKLEMNIYSKSIINRNERNESGWTNLTR